MSRLIKYRIPYFNADDSFSHFSYWGTIDHKGEFSEDGGCFTSPASNGLRKGWHEQLTGLIDEIGNEIYENDIVFHKSKNRIFIYGDGCFGFEGIHNLFVHIDQFKASQMKVIGNINANPELKSI